MRHPAWGAELARKKGLLRLLHDEVEAQVNPALQTIGFVRDPSLDHQQGWNNEGYEWHLVRRVDSSFIVRLWVDTGASRDPGLTFRWQGYLLDTEGQSIGEAAHSLYRALDDADGMRQYGSEAYGSQPIQRIHLSPYRSFMEPGFGIDRLFGFVPEQKLLQLAAFCVVYPLFLISFILFPVNIGAIFLDERWLRSDAARSGARQKKIAGRAARRIGSLPARLDRLRQSARPLNDVPPNATSLVG